MAITIEAARAELRRFRGSGRLQNLFAQAHAKRVLLDTDEPSENFPAFDQQLDDRVTWSAYAIISAACVIAEAGERAEAASALLEGAELLEHLHRKQGRHGSPSAFHMLLAAMAFYSAGHYSRAFVAMRDAEAFTPCAGVIGAFLRPHGGEGHEGPHPAALGRVAERRAVGDLGRWRGRLPRQVRLEAFRDPAGSARLGRASGAARMAGQPTLLQPKIRRAQADAGEES